MIKVVDVGIAGLRAQVEVTCRFNCPNCPMKEDDFGALLERDSCRNYIWIPTRHLNENKRNKDTQEVNKKLALRDFLQELGCL